MCTPNTRRLWPALSAVLSVGLGALASADASPEPNTRWRVDRALPVPAWLHFGLEHRLRFEHLEDEFRTPTRENSSALSMRTLLSAELRFESVVIGAEMQDSRVYASETTPLNTTHGNAVELLQGYASLRRNGVFASGDTTWLTVGRFTVDAGSRRLVARNEYRNTINGFTGIDAQWSSADDHAMRAFAALPVMRRPAEEAELRDNLVVFDRENANALFWGVFFTSAPFAAQLRLEAYLFGLHERDGRDAPSADRQLATPGVRLLRPAADGEFDFQLELMLQLGRSRASTRANDTVDLEHRAGALHASVGYRLKAAWNPRFIVLYDFASGDGDPKDGTNARFDTLFGARRFDFGPTGLYGPLGRSNISSPGLRVELSPHVTLNGFVAYRLVWLASATDAWTAAGLRDESGLSGQHLGQQLEGRLRWNVLTDNLAFEVGAAYFVRGAFATDAQGGDNTNPVFIYSQLTGKI